MSKLFACVTLGLFAVIAFPQTHPQFDAASVRVNQSNDRASTQYDPGRVDPSTKPA